MPIYRGDGGSGTSGDSASASQIAQYANDAENSANQAASSATNAANSATAAAASETDAENAATNAATSETNAANSASNASTSETNAASSATNAATSESNAASSASAASTSETNASTSETNAASSATSAASSASTATTQASAASTSATNAANSASAASTSESNAATSETNAASSASAASTSETNAASSASSASTSETNAATSATNAANSASAASTSETNAATSESNAATSESNAASSATSASTSATNAATSETNAATSATNAATSATNAATSATNAATSETNAAASFDSFDDRYLGAKASDPSVDNDGDALLTGALYFNSTSDVMRVYDGSAWQAAYVSAEGYLPLSGGTMTGDLTLNADPTSNLQAATKQYVDDIAAEGIQYHTPVRVEVEGNLNATYNNGTSGVGATLTNAGTQAALVIDDITMVVNDRVLIYEQTNATQNGIYTVTDIGSASTNWVLTRATDADSYAPSDPDALAQGSGFFVEEGTLGAGEKYVCNTVGTITFGTTNITFVQVATAQIYTGGAGININGSVITNTGLLTSGSTATNLTITSADINGGNIDGTIIGATTPAAGTFAALSATSLSTSGNISASGTLSGSNYNNSNWDTAYGWGDHSAAGYYVDGSSTLQATDTIKCGTDSSSPLGFTVNDGGGNANIVFNHFANATTTSGYNTARIVHNSDGTTASNLSFRTGTGGVAPSERLRIDDGGIDVTGAVTTTDSVLISQDGTLNASWDTEAALRLQGSYGGGVAWLDGSNGGWLGYVYNAGNNFVLAQATASASPSTKFEINQLGNTTIGGTLNAGGNITTSLDVNARDLRTDRGSQDGAVYFGSDGTNYLYYNGSSWTLSDGNLNVSDGGVTCTSLTATGAVTLSTNGQDLVIRDTGNTQGIDNYIWRDHSAAKLYLGSDDDKVEIRGNYGAGFTDTSTNQIYLGIIGGALKRLTTQGGFILASDSSGILHAGDQVNSMKGRLGITDATTAEELYVTADGSVHIQSGHQSSTAWHSWKFQSDGGLALPVTDASLTSPVNLNAATGVVRLTTGSGWLDLGAANGSYCHLQTDRPAFYFNKRIEINGGEIHGYNSDISLKQRGGYPFRLTGTTGVTQLQYQMNTYYYAGLKASAYYGTPYIVYRGNSDTALGYGIMFYGSAIAPGRWGYANADNLMDLGASSNRWDDVYATNGTIQTSDAREKQDVEELTEAERRVAVVAKGLLRKYRWKDKVAEKGDEARVHFGIIAQDLMAAFEAEGLDPSRYAMFTKTEWWIGEKVFEAQEDEYNEEGEITVRKGDVDVQPNYEYDNQEEAPDDAEYHYRLGIRYSELLAFIIAAI